MRNLKKLKCQISKYKYEFNKMIKIEVISYTVMIKNDFNFITIQYNNNSYNNKNHEYVHTGA